MALAIEIVLAAMILLAVGLAAVGRIDGMSRPVPDAPPGLPPEEVTPAALRQVRFPVVLRGYRMRDVDEALERVAVQLEDVRARLAEQEVTSTARTRPRPDAGADPLES